jgi:hypothetical protein
VVSLSQNNGLDWTEIASVTDRIKQMVALKPMIYRRYDYRLKFELKGAGTGLDAVSVINDIQHSQRPLPILDKGDNQITYSAGAQEGTITAYGSLPHNGEGKQGQKNLIFNDFHPVLEGVSPERFNLERSGGTVTVPIQTPGDMTRLRIGCFYRADDASDGWTIEASFDEGKTFVPVAALEGPNNGNSKYVVFGKVPAGIRAVQVRLTGHKKVGQLFIAELRIDADYKEPHGGLTPIKITYAYDEEGQPKTDVHVAKGGEENYTIHCEGKPVMKSITLELAP